MNNVMAAPIVINEFVASNGSTLADEDGDQPDWIELYNPGEEALSLEGWFLSDDEDDPLMWAFPAVSLEPGALLVVFASGKDRTGSTNLHTNFAISASGEPLLLSNPEGDLIDYVEPVELPRDVSYGRQPDGGDTWYFFTEPTPGSPNSTTPYGESLAPPEFSRVGGFYEEPFDLTLMSDEPGVEIFYTLDGSDPDPDNLNGTTYQYKNSYPGNPGDPFGDFLERSYSTILYQGEYIPIVNRSNEPNGISNIATMTHPDRGAHFSGEPIFKGTVVRAMAMREGKIPSDVVTHTYLIDEDGRDRYSLPVFSIAVQEDYLFDYERGMYVAGKIFDDWRLRHPNQAGIVAMRPANYNERGIEWEAPGHLEYFPAGELTSAFSQGMGMRVHGGGSRQLPIKSIRLYARSGYDDHNSFDFPFFDDHVGRGNRESIISFRRLILRNSGNDYSHTYFRDGFIQRLVESVGLDQVAFKQHIVFVNGEYWGIMNLRERPDQHHLAAHHSIDPGDIAILDNNAEINRGTEADRQSYLALRHFVDQEDMGDPEAFASANELMDMDNFIRYNAVQIYIGNKDWPGNNINFWRKITPDTSEGAPPTHDGRWRWILYDLDASFGFRPGDPASYNNVEHATRVNGPTWPNPDWSTRLFRNLLENDWFRHEFINTIADMSNSIFIPQRTINLVDEIRGNIEPYIPEFHHRYIGSARSSGTFLKDFANQRPGYIRQHIVEHFDLSGTASVQLDTTNPEYGLVRINSLLIDSDLPGLEESEVIYPWTGVYFQDVPMEVEAIPNPGYRFVGWEGDVAPESGPLLEVTLGGDISLTAIFEESLPPVVLQEPEILVLREEGNAATIDLYTIFDDPNGDPLEFDVIISHDHAIEATLDGATLTLPPHQRGDAQLLLTASNGNNPPVSATLNVLVHPQPHRLASAPFTFNHWDADHTDRTYPEHMLFLQSDITDPALSDSLKFAYHVPHDDYNEDDIATIGYPYNNTRRTRINGLGDNGISFINTGRGRDLGGALLSLDTRGVEEAVVSWRGTTITPNERIYAIRLLYRIGREGSFESFLIGNDQAMEYIRDDTPGHTQLFPETPMPTELLGHPEVQLLWRYYWITGEDGPRAELGLGDISVEATSVAPPEGWVLD